MKFEIHQPDEEPRKKFVINNPDLVNPIMNDLYKVGPDKPIGYLPIFALEDFSDKNEEDLTHHLESRGLQVMWYGTDYYTWDRDALQKLLDSQHQTLIKYNWPIDADVFVEKVATTAVLSDEKPDLFDLIADAFANKTNPLRSDRKQKP